MADSRKLFLVLAAIALFSASALAADVPINFTCVGNPTTNNQLRGGGITELVGDVLLTCGGGSSGTVNVAFAAQLTGGATAVTNRLGTLDNVVGGYPISAVLVVSDISNNVLQVVPGFLQANSVTQNIVLFPGVILPTGTTNTTVRIRNIRVATNPVTSTATQIPVYAQVSTTPASFPITNPLEQVGTVYPALAFSVTDCAGGAKPPLNFQQCISQPKTAGALSFGVKFSEQIVASAFKTTVEETAAVPQVSGPKSFTFTAPSTVTPTGVATSMLDVADHGTRLILRVSNVPSGVQIWVTDREIKGATASTPLAKASVVVGAHADGTGGTVGNDNTDVPALCGVGNATPAGVFNNDLPASTVAVHLVEAESGANGNVYAVWEVTGDNPINFDQLLFGVSIVYTANPGANVPALSTGAGVVNGAFAPISTVSVASSSADIPRFLDNPIDGGALFSINPCVTNLLFPYVTTRGGYNTGLALVNTSKDNVSTGDAAPVPFDTSSQTGGCTLYFFGANSVDPLAVGNGDSKVIDPGSLWKGVVGDLAPGFEGYIISRCNFQYAHGLAFILSSGGQGSQYLALVIPDRSGTVRVPDPFTTAGSGSGEQLGY